MRSFGNTGDPGGELERVGDLKRGSTQQVALACGASLRGQNVPAHTVRNVDDADGRCR